MQKSSKIKLTFGLSLLVLFIAFTFSLRFVGVKSVGVNNTDVAYAALNLAVHEALGTNITLYVITDWAGVLAIFVSLGFAILGLVQWIKRGNILKVDVEIVILGVFYVIVFATYLFFEECVINYRPVLIDGIAEPSYPSSTTLLATTVFSSAILVFKRLLKKKRLCLAINLTLGVFSAFMVVGRILSGVHWITDILGGLLLSTALVLLYDTACDIFANQKNAIAAEIIKNSNLTDDARP